MKYDAIIAGGGISGLTAASFLCKSGYKVLICEKEDQLGGLVGSFDYRGFTFDSGIRAMENSGILFPMLKQLNLDIDFLDNQVSIGIEDDIVDLTSVASLNKYQEMLNSQFPDDAVTIDSLIAIIKKTMDYMDILYGIDNPLFMDLKNDHDYIRKTLLPWMFKYLANVRKIKRLNTPVETYLRKITDNQVLIDIIAQHFFKHTPAFFALSYFNLYLDYNYPQGGTGTLISKLAEYIQIHGGMIKTNTLINSINPAAKTVADNKGNTYHYKKLIWAADEKALYASIAQDHKLPKNTAARIRDRKAFLADKTGGDSVLTLYLLADIDKSYFADINTPHFFYTPERRGISTLPYRKIRSSAGAYVENKAVFFAWVREFLCLNTFEISIPVMRDKNLAPPGKTGLIVSTLVDYSLVQHIDKMGWYDDFKTICRESITALLIDSVYPQLKGNIIDGFVSTPLTIERRTGNTGGAITGWAFTNNPVPAVSSMPRIASSIKTPIPDVLQAGQWTYSPSGFPISILTGKLAADRVIKQLSR